MAAVLKKKKNNPKAHQLKTEHLFCRTSKGLRLY